MTELEKLGEKTYVIKSPVNVGIFVLNENDVCVIDTGNSKDFGKIIEKVLIANNWNLKYIINTHSHADHIGGNKYLQDKYNCKIYSSKIESYFINTPIMESSLLYGANPLPNLCNHFLIAKESVCDDIGNLNEEQIEIINLEGHSVNLIGVVTRDNVLFLGDAYTSKKILDKYAVQYVYDIEKYMKTLNYLKTTNYKYYVPAHGDVESNPELTINENILNIEKIENKILNILNEYNNEIEFWMLIKIIFNEYHMNMNDNQYFLITATIKAFITKMVNDKKIEVIFKDNIMFIKKVTT